MPRWTRPGAPASWEELGADAITLESFSINRNFRRLAAIRQAVRCDLQLIANHVCLLNCPLQTYHLLDLARLQGMLSPLPECPIRVDARQIPENFLDGFRDRDFASIDCQACGYCERIAAQAVSIARGSPRISRKTWGSRRRFASWS